MNILISGAGTAGLCIAYWLKRYGFTPTIIESAPVLRTGGYKIDVRGEALKVLRRSDVYDAVVSASTDMQGALIVDREGKIIHKMTGDAFGHRTGDDQEIMRGTLNQILLNQIPDVEVIFGDSIKTITQFADSVKVEFKKGSSRSFDLIIGADGLHSNVRRLVFGDEARFVRELGIYLCVFTVPNYLNLDRVEMEFTELGRVAGIWSSRGDTNAKAYFAFTSSAHVESRDTAAQKNLIKDVFANVGGEVPKILSFMADTDDFYFDLVSQIDMDCWSLNRVILLGDAAYCASPMSGQGTSLALVGAYIFAGELAAAKGDYKIAFKQFEKIIRPYIQLNQELGLRAAKIFRMQEKKNPITWLIGKIMNYLPGRLVEFFIHHATKRVHRAANAIVLKDYLHSTCFTFKPTVESQRELVHRWLEQDYIREWVHGKGLNNLVNGLEKFYQYQKEGRGLERDSRITQHWIAYDSGTPFAYLLTSNVFKEANDEYAKYSAEEGSAITLDIFICDKNYLGKGLATLLIKEFLLSQFSDVTEIFIDPEKSNARAIHVYEKVGFRIVGEFLAPWHPVPHYIMRADMSDLKRNTS